MPFGGDDDAERRHSLGVYQSILKPAAEAAGYSVKRADIGRVPGNITADIIYDLANADMVIADLTGGSANVFFELGIRHVLRKSGTVHVVDRRAVVPFDVRQYRVIEYSTHLVDIPDVIVEIVDAIRKREDDAARSDNPVHDVLVGLPADYREVSDEARQAEIEGLRVALGTAKRERDSLAQKLTELDPGGSLAGQPSELDVDDLLDHADEIMKSTGEYAMLRLQQVINAGGRDAFVRELRSVVKSPYLSANDFLGLAQMCRGLDLTDHRRVVLEIANQRLPKESGIFLALIDAYDDSPAPALQERGRLMIEAYLKISRSDPSANPVVSGGLALDRLEAGLGLLFNFYFGAGRPEWVLSVCESADAAGYTGATLGRNQARALADLGRISDAESRYRETLAHYDDPSTHQFFGDFLNSLNRHAEAYEQTEAGVVSLPSNATAWLNLAIDIFNNNLTRNAEGRIVSIDEEGALRSAIPIIQAGLSHGDLAERQQAVNMLVRRNAMVEAQEIAQGNLLEGYDEAALTYLMNLIARRKLSLAGTDGAAGG